MSKSIEVTQKELWDALRLVCCSTKLNAHRIVMIHEHDIKKALEMIEMNKKVEKPS